MSEGLHLPGNQSPPPAGGALLGADAAAAMEQAGRRHGLICAGCGGPMDADGWEYMTLRTEMGADGPAVIISKAYVCAREQCASVRSKVEESATARRRWPAWHLFDVEVESKGESASNGDRSE